MFSKESTGSLLVGFFDYYTRVFDWRNDAVSIRLGRPRSRADWTMGSDGRLGIEDPFEDERDLCITMGRNQWLLGQERLLKALVQARELLTAGMPAMAASVWDDGAAATAALELLTTEPA